MAPALSAMRGAVGSAIGLIGHQDDKKQSLDNLIKSGANVPGWVSEYQQKRQSRDLANSIGAATKDAASLGMNGDLDFSFARPLPRGNDPVLSPGYEDPAVSAWRKGKTDTASRDAGGSTVTFVLNGQQATMTGPKAHVDGLIAELKRADNKTGASPNYARP